MSVELYDLGQRLRAGLAGRPVARSSHALALPPVRPIAVAVDTTGPTTTVTATDALASCTGRGPGALAALAQVYGPLSDDHRSLVGPGGPGTPAPGPLSAWRPAATRWTC